MSRVPDYAAALNHAEVPPKYHDPEDNGVDDNGSDDSPEAEASP